MTDPRYQPTVQPQSFKDSCEALIWIDDDSVIRFVDFEACPGPNGLIVYASCPKACEGASDLDYDVKEAIEKHLGEKLFEFSWL